MNELVSRTRLKHDHRYGEPTVLGSDSEAIRNSTTQFPTTVRTPGAGEWVLKAGEHQAKLGSHVTKGGWKGFPIFSLTLVERETCPESCALWDRCYGNNMHWAHRWRAGPELIEQLEIELGHYSRVHPDGFAVRLHTLGDFFDQQYVRCWSTWLGRHRPLHCFGFTAWDPGSPVGQKLDMVMQRHPKRFRIRWSNRVGPNSTRTIGSHPGKPSLDGNPICPTVVDDACRSYLSSEQMEKRKQLTCGSCTYCWSSDRPIIFVEH